MAWSLSVLSIEFFGVPKPCKIDNNDALVNFGESEKLMPMWMERGSNEIFCSSAQPENMCPTYQTSLKLLRSNFPTETSALHPLNI